ncbi:hypothetical protein BJY01DRAFT_220764 [Aspergillus pseudoustus]|uniref:TPR domain protein n=1 Tax=Aspergillus pseudoustus TaxID=1810923 RepID=A0ABR4JCF5_9EURO
MFQAAVARRTSNALMRGARIPQTPILPSRTIAFSTQPRPLQQITRLKVPNTSNLRVSPAIPLHNASITLQIRSLSYLQRTRLGLKQASKGIWRKYPFLLPFAILCVIGSFCTFFYIVYVEITHHMPQYSKFPLPVAKHLRTAVWYTDVDLNPALALKSYKDALQAASEAHMHPFSDEVMGIKLQIAMMLEKAGLIEASVKVLEQTKTETLVWVEKSKQLAAQREEEKEKRKKEHGETPPGHKLEIDDPEVLKRWEAVQKFDAFEEKQRAKGIKKSVGMALKLGELYLSDHMQQPELSEASYEAAVDIAMKELNSRLSQGLPVSGGEEYEKVEWLTRLEAAIALAQLAHTYSANEKRLDLAIPVFMRSLELFRTEEGSNPSCRQAQIMSEIGGTWGNLAHMPFKTQDPEASRKEAYQASKQWSMNALELSANVSSAVRDQGCDSACVVAMFNLGELAELSGTLKQAEKWYRDALALIEKHGDPEDGSKALLEEALERVAKK